MRSVVVVLPASMCAMMPIFLQRSNGTCLGTIPSVSCYAVLDPPSTLMRGPPAHRNSFRLTLGAPFYRLLLLAVGQQDQKVTTGSAQTPYWLRPCGAHLLSS